MRLLLTAVLLIGLGGVPLAGAAPDLNACGCYRDEAGACMCTNRKAKCECPGDCEPVACEARRQKAADKEAEATLRKINQREKKRAAEEAKAQKASKKKAPKPAAEPATKS